jgi:gliding motility-associated-like protein
VVKVDSCNPFTANFVNTSTSNLANNSTTIYTWNFGDGTGFTGKNPPLHTFPTIGIYTITLTMTDTNACNSPSVFTAIANYSVSNMSTAFNAPDSICLPANVFFMDQSTNATSWNWNFGDGGNSTTSSPSHTYTTPGVYTVYLISANPATCNKKDTAQQQISIFSSPIADFTWSPNPPVPNTPIEFKNFSTGATSYLWNFGDGTSSTDKDVVHNFYADGLYDVCLTAINEVGCKDTVCKKVRGIVVPLVDVPSGFSPNGDGVNDVVYVRGYGIEKMTFRIFNRWGEKLFESTNMFDGWDGRYKGIMQEMEVYQYTLNVTFFDKTNTTKKGSITLLK